MTLVGVLGACGDSDDEGETVTEDQSVDDSTTTTGPTTTSTTTPPSTTEPDGDGADDGQDDDSDPADPAPADTLEGTWKLDGIIDGETVSPVPDGGAATLTFPGEEGDLGMSVQDCNQGGTAIAVEGQEIEVDGLISTLMACVEPAATVESAIVSVLDGATITYAIEGDTLTLTHPDGHGISLQREG